MNSKILLVALAAGLLCACASNPDKIEAAYVSPLKYKDYDCDQIAMEMDYVGQRTNRLYQNLKKENKADKWQMGVGMLLFWPTLFALEGRDGPEATEYAQLKGEFEALRTTSVQKKCGYQSRTFKETVAEAAKKQPTAGTPPDSGTQHAVTTGPAMNVAQASTKVEQAPTAAEMPVDQSLGGFVGKWFMALTLEQGGRRTIALDKSEMIMADTDTISWVGKSNDVVFILKKNPQSDNYLFSYSFKEVLARKPLLSLDEIPLSFSPDEGYSGNKMTDDTKILLEIRIKLEVGKLTADILGKKDGNLLFKHHLNFSREETDEPTEKVAEATRAKTMQTADAGEPIPVETVTSTSPASAVTSPPEPHPVEEAPVSMTEKTGYSAPTAGSPGTWVGKTEQGFEMSAKIELVKGVLTVTALKYDIELKGQRYSVTKQMFQPETVSIRVKDGAFERHGSDYTISGAFRGDSLIGNLDVTDIHPQGIGTAHAYVGFNLKNTSAPKASKISEAGAKTITGILVDGKGQPIGNTKMVVHLGTTSEPLKANSAKKQGALTPIEGSGKINVSIVGVKDGGALKLIDGAVSNPSVETNDSGVFKFELTEEFLRDEDMLIITYQKTDLSSMVTQSYPILNDAGEPRVLEIDDLAAKTELGHVKLMDKD